MRKPPNLTEKLAACLLIIADLRGEGIPFSVAQSMHADQVISLFHFDHAVLVANGGSNHPTNLTPRWILDHRKKTAKKDVPELRKGQRLQKSHEQFTRVLLAKTGQDEPPAKPKSRWPKRKFGNR